MKKINLAVFFLWLSTGIASAQETTTQATPEPSIGLTSSELLVVALLLFAVILLVATAFIFKAFKQLYTEQIHPVPYQKPAIPELLDYETWLALHKNKPGIWTKLMGLKPLAAEKDMLLPEAYDGIHELNNPSPTWFNLLFGATFLFAVGYLYYYHVADGPRQDTEYQTEMVKAAEEKRVFLAKFSTNYDEQSVKLDTKLIAKGKSVFDANCVACHGNNGQGTVGPNLTDEFWLHGGSVNEVFKTVKYGVPEKGMISWEKNLNAQNIAEVSNYIMSLQGTKPAGAKAPQGEKYMPKSATEAEVEK